MRRLLHKLVFFSCLFLFACQGMIGATNLIGNALTAPIGWIKDGWNALTGNTYNSYVEKTDKKNEIQLKDNLASTEEKPDCIYRVGNALYSQEGFDNLSDDMKALAKRLCECKAWGNCPPGEFCKCDSLCPEDMSIFDHPDNKSLDSSEKNCLAFRNSPWESYGVPEIAYEDNPMSNGYCWGHASMTSKFNRLAFFRPGKKAPCEELANEAERCSRGDEKWVEYYEKLIDDIKNNIPREIPGFPDLYTFSSSEPSLRTALGNGVAHEWGEKAMTGQGISQILTGGRQMKPKEINKLYERVKTNERFNLNTQLLFSPKNHAMGAHVVLGTRAYELEDGTRVICIRDSNVKVYMTLDTPDGKCAPQNQMKISPDNKITYPRAVNMTKKYDEVSREEYNRARSIGTPGYRVGDTYKIETNPGSDMIGMVKVAGNDGNDTVRQLHSLRAFCKQRRNCK